MTSFSIGTNPTIATNGDPSYHHYNTNGVYLWVLDNPQMIIQKEAYLIDRGKTCHQMIWTEGMNIELCLILFLL